MKRLLTAFFILFTGASVHAQLLSWSPDFLQETNGAVTITLDATKGNQGLLNYSPVSDVYVHIGVITSLSANSSDWKYSKFTWGTTNALAQCTSLGNNKWSYTINGGLRSYFGITNANEKILKIAVLFRSGDGNKVQRNADASDMYVPVYDNALYTRIDDPARQPLYTPVPETITKMPGQTINITAKASAPVTLSILFNNNTVQTASNATSLTAVATIAVAGSQQIVAVADNGTTKRYDTISFNVNDNVNVAPLPANVKDGINYEQGDTSVTLVLYAPGKNRISVIGDFNNWTDAAAYQMNRTPDGNRFWLRITKLTSGVEYAYQYYVDNTLKVADYNAEKILDPANDQYISAATYPNLKAYPAGKASGIVSVLQTAKPAYNWQVQNFARPDKRNLVIYELLVRDFVAAQNWQTIKDTLSYLKRLGINAIEVMPFNEFEGNNSWGYNPSFYFAPDKAYGTETALRQFIDECHRQGIAVIMDIVLNHSFGQSPMVQLYWDAANSRPATNSPWFNPVAKHPFNVGYDFNHESQATKDFVDRVLEHWVTKYKIDGFRFDLSKGFTQKQTCDNNGNNCDVNAWTAYDSSRVAIWKRIYTKMQSVNTNTYCILEHLGDNNEEKDLSNAGMLLWGNMNYNFNQATMGFADGWNFDGSLASKRGWTNPYLIAYQESHDEERLMYKNLQFGNTSGGYTVKDKKTALQRNAMATAIWALMPGPKMLWQFGELGYDYSINTCENGSISNDCRTAPKPVKWDYYNDADRKALYNVYAKLFKLRNTTNYLGTFTTGITGGDLSGPVKSFTVTSDSLNIFAVGNFDVISRTAAVTFPATGKWYSYFSDSIKQITTATQTVSLSPGEYYVFTSRNLNNIVGVVPPQPPVDSATALSLKIYPNVINKKQQVRLVYTVPESGNVSIALYAANGSKAAEMLNASRNKGTYTEFITISNNMLGNLSGGFYYVTIRTGKSHQTQKILVML